MNFLKRVPVHYKGELHDVRLINFTVAMEEISDHIPSAIRVLDLKGRAVVSMVDVKLRKMRPVFMPPSLTFDYRHIAFRVLVDDRDLNNGVSKGIYFFRSFTDKPLIVAGGKLLTDYNLETAHISEYDNEVTVSCGERFVKYRVGEARAAVQPRHDGLAEMIGALDRAYAVSGDTLRVTQIQREKWPIQRVGCTGFENTFFKTAELLGVFRVFETIHYEWMPPKRIRR